MGSPRPALQPRGRRLAARDLPPRHLPPSHLPNQGLERPDLGGGGGPGEGAPLDFLPERRVGLGGAVAGGEGAHGHAQRGHLLDGARVGDRAREEPELLGDDVLGEAPVQRLAQVDHAQEGQDARGAALALLQVLQELGQRAQRERRRQRRREQHVARPEDALREQREARGAVEHHVGVLAGQGGQELAQALLGAPAGLERQVQVAVGEVGREQVEPGIIGGADRLGEIGAAADQRARPPGDLRLDAEGEARRALRVEVPEQDARARARGQVGDVDGRRRLAHAALEVVGREDDHPSALSRELVYLFGSSALPWRRCRSSEYCREHASSRRLARKAHLTRLGTRARETGH